MLKDLPGTYTNATFITRRNKFNSHTKRRPSKALAGLWHLQLGHPGPQALKQLVHHTQGIQIKGPTTIKYKAYRVSKAKQQIHRQPRDHNEGSRLQLALNLFNFKKGYNNYQYLPLIINK